MMKGSINTVVAAMALSTLASVPASAMVSKQDISNSVRQVLGAGSNVRATVNGDTVTLTGYYADSGDQNRVLQVVKNSEGVNRVINLATKSN